MDKIYKPLPSDITTESFNKAILRMNNLDLTGTIAGVYINMAIAISMPMQFCATIGSWMQAFGQTTKPG